LVVALAAAGFAWGTPSRAEARCFDFAGKVVTPLKAPIPAAQKGDAYSAGEKGDGLIWTQLRGTIAKPATRVLALLLNHDTMRDPEVDDMQVKKQTSPLYVARHAVAYEVRPFPMVKIRWTEEWAYAAAEGPAEAPTAWVISYEKTEGTSHIEHFCGNIVLRRLSDTQTDMYQYEESKIDRHDQADQTKGLRELLAKLRKLP
jgi:hypothetical protein